MTFTPPYTSPCVQVSAANVWCAKYRPKALKLRVLTGVHSPDQFRVQVHHFENGFKKPTLPLLMTYIFRGHSPTWMTFHGTLTAQLGQIWIHQRRINARWISMLWKQQIWSRVFMLTFPILPFPQVWWPAAAAKDCDPNQKRIRPFVFLISPDQTTSRLIMYLFLHYDDMKAFIMFLWSKTIFIHIWPFCSLEPNKEQRTLNCQVSTPVPSVGFLSSTF